MKVSNELAIVLKEACEDVDSWEPWQHSREAQETSDSWDLEEPEFEISGFMVVEPVRA